MKLPIKENYFNEIKIGLKNFEFRDAHITFVCEKTGEEMRVNVKSAFVLPRPDDFHPDVLEDKKMIVFELE